MLSDTECAYIGKAMSETACLRYGSLLSQAKVIQKLPDRVNAETALEVWMGKHILIYF